MFDEEVGRWVRLYQEYLLLIARKCGKTPLVAAMDLAEWFCGEMGTKILCSSTTMAQADLMFQAIDAMREESRTLEKSDKAKHQRYLFGNKSRRRKRKVQ